MGIPWDERSKWKLIKNLQNSMNHFAVKTRLYMNAMKDSIKELHSMNEDLP